MFGLGRYAGLVLILSTILSCKEDAGTGQQMTDDFDRASMLSFWADEVIIPAYQNYHGQVLNFQQATKNFQLDPTEQNLQYMREAYASAYRSWQWVSIYAIGPAESEQLLNFTNIYPCDTAELNQAIIQGNLSLNLPSTFDIQGWPAIDYLIYGNDPTTAYQSLVQQGDRLSFLMYLANRLEALSKTVLEDWQNGYRDTFVSQQGSGADASTNKLINDFVYHYEKELRAGKIGIPAGVFSGSVLESRVEAVYSDTLSKSLFLEGLTAHRNFFSGISFNQDSDGPSLQSYLDYLKIERGGELLSSRILNQFELIQAKADNLPNIFKTGLENNATPFLETYDALQQNVIWLKVDMMQALNVRVDYVDADGD